MSGEEREMARERAREEEEREQAREEREKEKVKREEGEEKSESWQEKGEVHDRWAATIFGASQPTLALGRQTSNCHVGQD